MDHFLEEMLVVADLVAQLMAYPDGLLVVCPDGLLVVCPDDLLAGFRVDSLGA